MPEGGDPRGGQHDDPQRVVDACTRCFGYVKTFTALEACPPLGVMIRDLETVALDLAAIDNGHARPSRAGYSLELRCAVS